MRIKPSFTRIVLAALAALVLALAAGCSRGPSEEQNQAVIDAVMQTPGVTGGTHERTMWSLSRVWKFRLTSDAGSVEELDQILDELMRRFTAAAEHEEDRVYLSVHLTSGVGQRTGFQVLESEVSWGPTLGELREHYG